MQRVYAQNYWLKKSNPQLGLSWGDIESSLKESVQKELNKIPQQVVSTAASNLLKQPEVSAAATSQAEKAALEASVSQLQQMKADLAAQLEALKKDPIAFAKANPGKVAMVAGGVLAAVATLLVLLRGISK